MKHTMVAVLACAPLVTLCPIAAGQAVTEYGLGAGQAVTNAAPARNLGKGISGALDNLSKTAGAAGTTETGSADSGTKKPSSPARSRSAHKTRAKQSAKAAAATETSASAAPAQPSQAAPPAPVYEDAKEIQPGIAYAELIRRFGPPSMSITTGPGKSTLLYSSAGNSYQIELESGIVVAPRRKTSE